MTKKIKNIGSAECKIIIPEMLSAMQKTLNKYGLQVDRSGGARYGGHNMTIKFEVTIPEKAEQQSENDYNTYKDMYDIKAPYGFTFKNGTKEYTIVGLNHKAKKNRILLKDSNGGNAHCPVRMVNWEFSKSPSVEVGA